MRRIGAGSGAGSGIAGLGIGAGVCGALLAAALGGLALAQERKDPPRPPERPESLLPPGFDNPPPAEAAPAPAPLPTAAPIAPAAPAPAPARDAPQPAQPLDNEGGQGEGEGQPGAAPGELPPLTELSDEELSELPTLEELEKLSTDELDELFGLKPKYDIPPAARRSLARVGVIARGEGGFPAASLRNQPASLVRAILEGTTTPMVSRWGHILMRRALASRLAAPQGMEPVEFAALRAGALNAMGEFSVARALIQDVDAGNWSPAMAQAALTAFVAEADPLGVCPYVRFQGVPESAGDEERAAQWQLTSAICDAYAGDNARANAQLDRALNDEVAPAIDILLARRFAGAAGRGRRGVSIDWEGVTRLNSWRFSLAKAVGEPVPEALLNDLDPYFERAGSIAPMVPLAQRALFAERAGAEGIFSAQALIDLYSEIYNDVEIGGDLGERAAILRTAYLASEPGDRIDAMETLWANAGGAQGSTGYWAKALTAYAAARVAPTASQGSRASGLIASMLAAGLDRDALSWRSAVEEGSEGWALITLADPDGGTVGQSGLDSFVDDDASPQARKSQFLIAALAGMGRLDADDRAAFESRLSIDLGKRTRWVRMIARAGEVQNPAMVALLTGLGMQGSDWAQMTPLHLYHIVSALMKVGLEAEARMIAAEAVARA